MAVDIQVKNISRKFSKDALETILEACSIAYKKGQRVCTSAHLYQVLCQNSSLLNLLDQIRFDYRNILDQIEPLLRNTQSPINIKRGKVLFSPDLKKTILRSYLITKNTAADIVRLEDLFLATLYSLEIYKIIKSSSFDISNLENFINTLKGGMPNNHSSDGSLIARFTTNLSQKAKESKLEKVVGREAELAQVTRILARHKKNNVILLGEVGVGKTSIIHLLALKAEVDSSIFQLKDTKILEFNLPGFITSLMSRNVSELTDILKEEFRNIGNVILFIKNFEYISSETSIASSIVLNMIKSLLSTNETRFILSMNTIAYKKILSKEASFISHFEIVKIQEPSIESAIVILEKVSERLSKFHKIGINKKVIQACVTLSKRYIQDKFLPSKAIDLLDETSSKVGLENRREITVDDIKSVISEKTGIPLEKLTISEQKKLIDLENILNKTVIGQKEAVHIVSEVVRRSRAGLKDPKRPIGSFLFLGPSGVGKTFLAKNLTKIVYDNENALIRLDMSEFSESHTVQRLIGSPPGYIGYEEGGQLTNPVWERPFCLILLDEIEKAHPKVFDVFLQVLDEGRLTDGQGRTVDFKNTIIIATSNIASEEILERLSLTKQQLTGFKREKFYEEEILPLLKLHFRPEFINRFDEIVIFNPLEAEQLKEIAKLQIAKIQKRLTEKKITLNISDQKLSEFAKKSYNPAFGARPLIRLIQDQVENTLAKKIISGEVNEGDTVNL